MKTKTILTGTTFAAALLAVGAFAEDTNKFKSDLDRQSYAIGVNLGNAWKQQEIEVNPELLIRGITDAKSGGTLLLSEPELRDTFNKLRQEVMAKQQEKQRINAEKLREQGEKNKTEGAAFLATNKNNPGIISLPSGLQYKVLAEGDGPSPKPEDRVTVNYRGTVIDGTEFDKSSSPTSFAANGVIKGWTEALTHMKKGAKWQLFIPSELAYGEPGRPPKIAPNSVLIFDVELVSFETPPPPPPAPTPQPLTSDIIKVPSLEEMKKGAKIETIKAEDVEKLQKQAQDEQKKKEPEKKDEPKK